MGADVLEAETLESDILERLTDYETERGKPVPGKNHSKTQLYLSALLFQYELQKRISVFSELSLELGEWRSTPDICVYAYKPNDWFHDEIRVSEPPLLAIEILSPKQSLSDLTEKAELYLQHGVKSCWIALPALRMITVINADLSPVNYSSGVIADATTGVSVTIEDVFQ